MEAIMKKYPLNIAMGAVLLFSAHPASAAILISELVTNTDDDWVELVNTGGTDDAIDVSGYFVTMYYGSNERMAAETVSLSGRDLPGTPWDDRYVVVHLCDSGGLDETDSAGDLNGNGRRDIYCSNYSGSLWNSDCIVAIDTDDDPAKGMMDCVAYSNRDGTMNENIESYVRAASRSSQWIINEGNIQLSCVDIGVDGLSPFMSLCRREGADSNSAGDFFISRYPTPGAANVPAAPVSERKILKVWKRKMFIRRSAGLESIDVPLLVAQPCNIRFRVFSVTGVLLFESRLYRDVPPGDFSVSWRGPSLRRGGLCGMYIGLVEATGKETRSSASERVFLVVGR
jgi:hypothetical protein